MAQADNPSKFPTAIFKESGAGRNGGVKSSLLYVQSGTLDESHLTNTKASLWEKYTELAKVPSERAKMTTNLLKIVDKVMIKAPKYRDKFFTQVDIYWFMLTGEVNYKFRRGVEWPYKGEFGL
jgi:hypothetical protein